MEIFNYSASKIDRKWVYYEKEVNEFDVMYHVGAVNRL